MGFPIRVLLVEDDAAAARQLEEACAGGVDGAVAVSVATDPDEARTQLERSEFDLVVHDLAEDVELFRALGSDHPGVPLVVLSEASDPAVINELLAVARKQDLFGTDTEVPMVRFYPREGISDCADGLRELLGSMAEVASLPVEAKGALELSTSEQRAIQIFARRTGADAAEVTPLGGGLSGAKTVVIDAAERSGMRTAHVVGKLAPVRSIPGAVDGYENAIPYLPAGLGAALAGVVTAGAGKVGAVFFRLADDYRRSYFECLAEAPPDAAAAVRRLHQRFADGYARAPVERQAVAALRRGVVSDQELRDAGLEPPSMPEIEGLEVEAARGIQHRDLHGLNLLVSDSAEPLLIDYDNYAPANAALDPVTLELSAIFHRDESAQRARRGWPSPEAAGRWWELDGYLEGCPYPEAIRACRAWAEDAAASRQELAATLIGVAIRQLAFENTDKDLARALMEAGRRTLA